MSHEEGKVASIFHTSESVTTDGPGPWSQPSLALLSYGDPSPDHGGRWRRPQAEGAAAPTGENSPDRFCRGGGAGCPLPRLLVPRRLAVRFLEIRG